MLYKVCEEMDFPEGTGACGRVVLKNESQAGNQKELRTVYLSRSWRPEGCIQSERNVTCASAGVLVFTS